VRIERVVLVLGSLEQMKLDETGALVNWESRLSHTCSKSSSEPFFTRNRFIAMNIILLPARVWFRSRLCGPVTVTIDFRCACVADAESVTDEAGTPAEQTYLDKPSRDVSVVWSASNERAKPSAM
jgi:hypothetical protein